MIPVKLEGLTKTNLNIMDYVKNVYSSFSFEKFAILLGYVRDTKLFKESGWVLKSEKKVSDILLKYHTTKSTNPS